MAGGGAWEGMDPEPSLRLVMEKGPSEGQILEFLPRTKIRIGRIARGNNVTIKDEGISTKHLAINFETQSGRAGSYWSVCDLGSSNGTILNSDSLEPFSPARLFDGDIIKIGECTSIRVRVAVVAQEGSKRGRRKPRRVEKMGLAVVDEDTELELGKVEKNEDLRCKEVLDSSEISEQMVSIGHGIEGRIDKKEILAKKVSERRTKSKNKEEILMVKNGVDENIEETENVVENLRPRRGRVAKKEEILGEDSNQNGVERTLGEQEQQESSKRVTRAMRKELNLAENASTRRTTRRTRKEGNVKALVQDAGMGKEIKGKVARAKKDLTQIVKDSEVGKEIEMVEENSYLQAEEIKEVKEDLPVEEMMERKEDGFVDGLVGKEGLNSGMDGSGTSSGSGIKKDNLNVLDLEKITLGEWLDYLEDYLPNHIINTTEEMILGMRQKAEKFHKFMLQQKNSKDSKEKVGFPVG